MQEHFDLDKILINFPSSQGTSISQVLKALLILLFVMQSKAFKFLAVLAQAKALARADYSHVNIWQQVSEV